MNPRDQPTKGALRFRFQSLPPPTAIKSNSFPPFQTNPCKHPVFYMNDVKFETLKSILEYMYLGEVHISNDNLKEFIRVAEGLKIRGLTQGKGSFALQTATSHSTTSNNNNNNNEGGAAPSSVSQSMDLDFDSDISQQSTPNAESTKRIKLSECFEAIAGTAVVAGQGTQSGQEHQHSHQQPQQQTILLNHPISHHHSHHQQHHAQQQQQSHAQHHPHHSHHLSHQQQQQHSHSELKREKIHVLEPKVEMVEILPSSAAVQAGPPPAYCQMQPSLVIATGTGGEKATLTLAPEGAVIFEEKIVSQEQHLQQEGQWIEEKQEQSTIDTSAIQETSSSTDGGGGGGGGRGNGGKGKSSKAKKQANCLNPHPCPVCARLYSNVSNLRQHMRLIHNRTEVCCPLCQKNFNSQLYLKRHYTSVHGYPQGSFPSNLVTVATVTAGGGGSSEGRRSDEGGKSNNNGQANGGAGGGGGGGGQLSTSHGNSGWNLYEMDSSPGNLCQ